MIKEPTLEQYLDALLKGDRKQSRSIIQQTLQTGALASTVYAEVIWPIMVEIENLLRTDRITTAQEHMATRINRTIVDQMQNKLPCKPSRNKKIAICCEDNEIQELGAQMTADLFESDGWEVRFLGGGLNNDDILAFINNYGPDILLIYGTAPKQAPAIRKLIDYIKSVNAWPDMKIMVSGGLFNRADGLWAEIGADLFAPTAVDAIEQANSNNPIQPEPPTIGKRKKRKKAVSKVPKQPANKPPEFEA